MADRVGIHRRKAERVTNLQPGAHRNRLTVFIEGQFPTEDTREARHQQILARKRALDAQKLKVDRSLISILALRRKAEIKGDIKEVKSQNVNLESLRRYYTNQLLPMITRIDAIVMSLDKTKGLKSTVEAMALAEAELQLAALEFDPEEIEDISENLGQHTDDIDSHIKTVKTFETADLRKAKEKLETSGSDRFYGVKEHAKRPQTKVNADKEKKSKASEVAASLPPSPRSRSMIKRQDTPVPRKNHRGGKGGGGSGGDGGSASIEEATVFSQEEEDEREPAEEEEEIPLERKHRNPPSPSSDTAEYIADDERGDLGRSAIIEEDEESENEDLFAELLSPELDPPTGIPNGFKKLNPSQSTKETREKV